MTFLTTPLAETLQYFLAVLGMYVAFRVLRYPDLSVDSVFAFGGVMGAFFLLRTGNLVASVVLVAASGFAVGCFTSLLFTVFRISKLLSGILTYSLLYSVNLAVFQRPNIPYEQSVVVGLPFAAAMAVVGVFVLFILLSSTLGKLLLGYGDNPRLIEELEIPVRPLVLVGLGVSTALISLSGFVVSLQFGFADVALGNGTLLYGVAAIILGHAFAVPLPKSLSFLSVLVGLFVYSFLLYVAVAVLAPLVRPSDSKLVSSGLVIVVLIVTRKRVPELFGFK